MTGEGNKRFCGVFNEFKMKYLLQPQGEVQETLSIANAQKSTMSRVRFMR